MRHFLSQIDRFWKQSASALHKWPLWRVLFYALATLGFVFGGLIASRTVNARSNQGDQNAYLMYARKLHETGYAYLGDRNRMPLYPGLQALFGKVGEKRKAMFERGKLINIGLSVLG